MTAHEKNRKIFGSIESLKDEISWTTGLLNMVEYLVWETKSVLGISKTQLIKQIVEWCDEDELKNLSFEDKYQTIKDRLDMIMSESESIEKYERGKKGYCSPREALRRNKYFSEDYLNKEFDIFLNLCSSKYLDKLYSKYISFDLNNKWSTHGNSHIYVSSVEITKMQMDNLAYNHSSKLLVANELKLGGKKNKDQILKYCYMFAELVSKGFIDKSSKFLLLFIGDKKEEINIEDELKKEIDYVTNEKKLQYLLEENIFKICNDINISSLTWDELIIFNEQYAVNNTLNEVESKLLLGFNSALKEKAFL